MGISRRDRISVDLRGIGSAVAAYAAARAISVSELVRECLARLAVSVDEVPAPAAAIGDSGEDSVRISLRMTRSQALALRRSARAAALPTGAYVAALVDGGPSLASRAPRADAAAALVSSCSVLAVLARDLRHLTQLLGKGEIRAAQEYRARLDEVEATVQSHLRLAAEVLGDLDALRSYRRGAKLTKE
jgi:hypothetical protein